MAHYQFGVEIRSEKRNPYEAKGWPEGALVTKTMYNGEGTDDVYIYHIVCPGAPSTSFPNATPGSTYCDSTNGHMYVCKADKTWVKQPA